MHNLNSKHSVATNIKENFSQNVMDMLKLIPQKFTIFLLEKSEGIIV